MQDASVWMWLLTGAVTLISILGGTIYVLLREEAKSHAEQLRQKANSDDMAKIEERWKEELRRVEDNSERLIDKLELKHTREIDALATRFGEALRSTEANILNQIKLMVEVLRAEKE